MRETLDQNDRSRNVMLFGLPEGKSENLEQTVGHVFEELGEKPVVVEVSRIGQKSTTSRPVIVTLSSCSTATDLSAWVGGYRPALITPWYIWHWTGLSISVSSGESL